MWPGTQAAAAILPVHTSYLDPTPGGMYMTPPPATALIAATKAFVSSAVPSPLAPMSITLTVTGGLGSGASPAE